MVVNLTSDSIKGKRDLLSYKDSEGTKQTLFFCADVVAVVQLSNNTVLPIWANDPVITADQLSDFKADKMRWYPESVVDSFLSRVRYPAHKVFDHVMSDSYLVSKPIGTDGINAWKDAMRSRHETSLSFFEYLAMDMISNNVTKGGRDEGWDSSILPMTRRLGDDLACGRTQYVADSKDDAMSWMQTGGGINVVNHNMVNDVLTADTHRTISFPPLGVAGVQMMTEVKGLTHNFNDSADITASANARLAAEASPYEFNCSAYELVGLNGRIGIVCPISEFTYQRQVRIRPAVWKDDTDQGLPTEYRWFASTYAEDSDTMAVTYSYNDDAVQVAELNGDYGITSLNQISRAYHPRSSEQLYHTFTHSANPASSLAAGALIGSIAWHSDALSMLELTKSGYRDEYGELWLTLTDRPGGFIDLAGASALLTSMRDETDLAVKAAEIDELISALSSLPRFHHFGMMPYQPHDGSVHGFKIAESLPSSDWDDLVAREMAPQSWWDDLTPLTLENAEAAQEAYNADLAKRKVIGLTYPVGIGSASRSTIVTNLVDIVYSGDGTTWTNAELTVDGEAYTGVEVLTANDRPLIVCANLAGGTTIANQQLVKDNYPSLFATPFIMPTTSGIGSFGPPGTNRLDMTYYLDYPLGFKRNISDHEFKVLTAIHGLHLLDQIVKMAVHHSF